MSYGADKGSNGLLSMRWPPDIKVGEYMKSRNSLNRLVGRSILSNSNGFVGKKVRQTLKLGKGSNTNVGMEVVNINMPSVHIVTLEDVLTLSVLSHLIKRTSLVS